MEGKVNKHNKLNFILYIFIHNPLETYSCNAMLCGCVSPHQYCASSINIQCQFNDICYLLVLHNWYRVCVECSCPMSYVGVSPQWHSSLHGCNFLVYMVVMLCYTVALRSALIAFSSCILYIPVLVLSGNKLNIEMKYESLVDESLPVIGAFRPVKGDTTMRYKNIYYTKWL